MEHYLFKAFVSQFMWIITTFIHFLFINLFIYLSLFIYLLFIYLFIYLYIYYLFIYSFIYLSIYLLFETGTSVYFQIQQTITNVIW